MKPVTRKLTVPIYDATLWIVVTHDLRKTRARMAKTFGEFDAENCAGLCCWSNDKFGVIFETAYLKTRGVEMVAHEVFHMTHRILQWSGTNFDESHHEHAALLHGWLMRKVMEVVDVRT